MNTRTTATPLGTGPIWAHICIKSISSLRNLSLTARALRVKRAESNPPLPSVEMEVDRDREDDLHGLAAEQGRRVLPLRHRVDRRLVEQSVHAAQDVRVLDAAILRDRRLDRHD